MVEFELGRDIINIDKNHFESASRWLSAAAIAELFCNTVKRGKQYGYLCTGEAFIFVHIPSNDPTIAYYWVSIPEYDAQEDDVQGDARGALYYTAVAQVLAFTLRALAAEPTSQQWCDLALRNNSTWNVDYDDVLRSIPETVRKEERTPPITPVQDQPYCTQACLVGLANKGPVDRECPNSAYHGPRHIDLLDFQQLIKAQLAGETGDDVTPLYISGAVGSLFKVRLTSHGYTLIAKGVVPHNLKHLQHENKIYDYLRPIQGKHVPVCLGMITLVTPYFHYGIFRYFMFLSWAGECSLRAGEKAVDKAAMTTWLLRHTRPYTGYKSSTATRSRAT
ncbi:hypothetical protein F4819DRAFT_311567 [Hypoxylon fuscum]|nr:hypothetical protein F4819DRAFT_311567 [Hypoxylon fuscum]